MPEYKVAIHWFRNGLRLHDNECLRAACQQSKTLVPLYIIDDKAPFAQTAGKKAGTIRANFILESMQEINDKLSKLNSSSRLLVVIGSYADVLPKIVSITEAEAIFYEKEAAAPIRKLDAEAIKAVRDGGNKDCKFVSFETHNLHPMDKYLSQCPDNAAPATFGKFEKIFKKFTVPQEVNEVDSVPPLPDKVVDKLIKEFDSDLTVPSLEKLGYKNAKKDLENRAKGGCDFIGGEDTALKILENVVKKKKYVATFEKPKTSPNDASKPSTTALSPYIKHGCISPRRFYHEIDKVLSEFNSKEVSKPPSSLHGQLMWREYNYLTGYTTPNYDKMRGNPIARQIPWDDNAEILDAWKLSMTGYPYIDAIMTQLRETGWIHHLARHSVACFLTRGDLWQSWEKGAEVFEYYLIDADWNINNFNWQWLSCTSHFYQYFRCYSPVAFGKKTDPNGLYIKKWLPQFKDMPAKYVYEPWEAPLAVQKKCGVIVGENYPHPIVDHKTISKDHMDRMKKAYDADKSGDPLPESPNMQNYITEGRDRKKIKLST